VEIILTPEQAEAYLDGKPLRISVRNWEDVDNPLLSFPYSFEANLEHYAPELAWPTWEVELDGAVPIVPPDSIDLHFEDGRIPPLRPTPTAVEDGYIVFFRPDDPFGTLTQTTDMIMLDSLGRVAVTEEGVVGYAEELDDGLAIRMAGLQQRYGPYSVHIENFQERVDGSVYLCPNDSPDCYEHDPRRDGCGGASCGETEVCCYEDPGRQGVCRGLTDDENNCGGCGHACEWDETCLEGICARGEGLSCWETECPAGTWCVSDVPFFLTDPKCKALLVDNENCGWYGHECAANRKCLNGLCRLKRRMPCSSECDEGTTCCWTLGMELCVDTENDPFHCGSCGTLCSFGNLCQEGTCQPWYNVLGVCGWDDMVNCGTNGELDCKDLSVDNDNCGACGLRCTDAAECVQGACTSPIRRFDPDWEP
jgi:hypothetical protein